MRVWWVNHNQTFEEEVGGGFIWSPKRNANGARNQFYDNLTEVKPGDVVLSFARTKIQAVGVATATASTSPKPFVGGAGGYWNDEGWYVPVSFHRLAAPLRPKDYIEEIRPLLAAKYSPINEQGNGNQGAYLSAIEAPLATLLFQLMGADFDNTLALAGGNLDAADEEANAVQYELEMRQDISAVEIHQLVKARRGQGVYKSNLQLVENRCRVTGLELQQHLVASHIKPWAKATDSEKLDGFNGLLLSPHVDHLFDRGYISFEDNGVMLLSKQLQYRVLSAWHISPDTNVGGFRPEQCAYLEWHRDMQLRQPA